MGLIHVEIIETTSLNGKNAFGEEIAVLPLKVGKRIWVKPEKAAQLIESGCAKQLGVGTAQERKENKISENENKE